jgi:hypothetical protein
MTISEKPWLTTPIARHIRETRYRWMKGGKALEAGIEESWQRVARTAASVEPDATSSFSLLRALLIMLPAFIYGLYVYWRWSKWNRLQVG